MHHTDKLYRLRLQFFGDEPPKPSETPPEIDKDKPTDAVTKAIDQLKKKLTDTETKLKDAEKKIAEQDAAIAALMDGDKPNDRKATRFWDSLRNIKQRG